VIIVQGDDTSRASCQPAGSRGPWNAEAREESDVTGAADGLSDSVIVPASDWGDLGHAQVSPPHAWTASVVWGRAALSLLTRVSQLRLRFTRMFAFAALKINVGRTTIADILKEAGLEPAPERDKKRTWKQFMRSHSESLYACDFFSVETLGLSGLQRHMVLFVMEVQTRMVKIAGIRVDPDGAWMKQMARNLTDCVDGFLLNAKYLIHDRDPLFTDAFRGLLRSSGVKPSSHDSPRSCTPLPHTAPGGV
jgi:hypothetical protein